MNDRTKAPSSDLEAVAALLKKLDICMLVSRSADGELHGRPMSNNGEVEYDGDSWFFAFGDSRKIGELEADPRAELAFIDTPNGTWINVEGEAEIIRDDVERKKELWLKDLERWFSDGPEDPNVVLIKVRARHVDAWAGEDEYSFDVR
jgi:general stress protein 26